MSDFVFRLVISDSDVRKVRLSQKPTTVDDFKKNVKDMMNITSDFVLMYEDKDFNNDLFTLLDMAELQPFATVRVVEVHVEKQTTAAVGKSISSPDNRRNNTEYSLELIGFTTGRPAI